MIIINDAVWGININPCLTVFGKILKKNLHDYSNKQRHASRYCEIFFFHQVLKVSVVSGLICVKT